MGDRDIIVHKTDVWLTGSVDNVMVDYHVHARLNNGSVIRFSGKVPDNMKDVEGGLEYAKSEFIRFFTHDFINSIVE